MIVKLNKDSASTEDISGNIFYYGEDGFGIVPNRRKKVRFFTSEKALNFLGTLELMVRAEWDALEWIKKNKL